MIAFEIFLFTKGLWFDMRYLCLIGTIMSKKSLHLVIKISNPDLASSRLDSKRKIYWQYSSAEKLL